MKATLVWTMLLFTLSLFIFMPHTAAVDTSEWGLPEGAKARLGKGGISGNIVYSPDGARLAVASSVGTWLYDAETYQPLSLLTGHTDSVTGLAFSPDGLLLATGSGDKTVCLYDAVTGERKLTLEGHRDIVFSVAFSPDGKTIVSGSNDNTIRFWDVLTGAHKQTLEGHTDRINSVAFSPDGQTLVSGSEDFTVRLWDVITGANKQTLEGHGNYVLSVAFSPDGLNIASGSEWNTIILWDAVTGELKQRLSGHTDAVASVAFSPDGLTLASGSWDHTIHLWDAMTGKHKQTLTGHADQVKSVAFSPDGLTLTSGSRDGTVRFWDTATGKLKQTLTGHTFNGYNVAFSPDGLTLASGNWDGTIRLWDATTGEHRHTLTGHTYWVFNVAFSPDGLTLASVEQDGTIRLWDVTTGQHKQTLTEHPSLVVLFSPDGTTLASGNWDGTIRLWDATTGQHKHTLTSFSPDDMTWVASIAFSPDGLTLASGSADGPIHLLDAATGKHKHTLTGHTRTVESVAFSPDGLTLASGSSDGTIRLWDAATVQHKHTLTGHGGWVYSVAFSPDGLTLASGDGANVFLWDLTLYLDISEGVNTTAEVEENQILQNDEFTGEALESYWHIQNADKSPHTLQDGKLVVEAGYNQNLWREDTTTRFYQITEEDQFTVETSFVFDHDNFCSVSGLVISSPTTKDRYGRDGEWVTLKAWGQSHRSVLQFQQRQYGAGDDVSLVDTPPKGDIPISMRLQRDGDKYNAWYKSEGKGEWIHMGETTVALQEPLQVGLYVGICEGATGSLTVSFDNFTVTETSGVPAEPTQPVEREEIRIIGGRSTDYTDSQGRVWYGAAQTNQDWGGWVDNIPAIAENRFINPAAHNKAMAAGYDPELFYAVSFTNYPENLNYQFNTGNGVFDVTYLVGEHWVPNNRGFDIIIEDVVVEPLYVTPGLHEIDIKTYRGIEVTDGVLNIRFEGNSATGVADLNPMFSALEIIPSSGETTPILLVEDINKDGVVNILDLDLVSANFLKSGENIADVNSDGTVNIIDLTLVASAFGQTATGAPYVFASIPEHISAAEIEQWLREARKLNLSDPAFQRGILVLEQLLRIYTPKQTALLPNYPNPFNPETWIPYQLAKPANVSISIFATDGKMVRRFNLGHQLVGTYQSRSQAAYWNGKNTLGESVSSGVYFYTLTAGDFVATRKMLILK